MEKTRKMGSLQAAMEKYLEYLRSVRNASPHTVMNYGNDLEQFVDYLTTPDWQDRYFQPGSMAYQELEFWMTGQGTAADATAATAAAGASGGGTAHGSAHPAAHHKPAHKAH